MYLVKLRFVVSFNSFFELFIGFGCFVTHAETHKADIRIEPREHSGYGWFLYHDALNVIGKKYGDTRKVLKQASDYLKPHKKIVKPVAGVTIPHIVPKEAPAKELKNH